MKLRTNPCAPTFPQVEKWGGRTWLGIEPRRRPQLYLEMSGADKKMFNFPHGYYARLKQGVEAHRRTGFKPTALSDDSRWMGSIMGIMGRVDSPGLAVRRFLTGIPPFYRGQTPPPSPASLLSTHEHTR